MGSVRERDANSVRGVSVVRLLSARSVQLYTHLLGCSLSQLSDSMGGFNYRAFSLYNTEGEVDLAEIREATNVVFLEKGRTTGKARSGGR